MEMKKTGPNDAFCIVWVFVRATAADRDQVTDRSGSETSRGSEGQYITNISLHNTHLAGDPKRKG